MTGSLRALAGQVTRLLAIVTLAVILSVGRRGQIRAVALQMTGLVAVVAQLLFLVIGALAADVALLATSVALNNASY